eukprot:CAMPEP_0113839736 /NCGR_PEP_ID=MMETSP0328-20130328/11239_1 /TAXON_ID=39455 /ORGANISM="Alexandrium minutum" /LENGTH=98 /DNA_ID=CAMNT_0000808371 /DNA_START=38 /DNA_END=334 /DNA_ORIENTATION=- /assembly_acc=CAM_ASM_000350
MALQSASGSQPQMACSTVPQKSGLTNVVLDALPRWWDGSTSAACSPAFTCRPRSLVAEEEVREDVGHVLVKLILRGQEHGLVVDEQQQQVEEEQQNDA